MELKIESLIQKGVGLARNKNGKVVFISNVLPGEVVEAKIIKEKKDYDSAVCVRILSPSKDRVTPVCPYFGVCGGCNLMQLSYSAQIKYKEQLLADTLSHFSINSKKHEEIQTSNPLGYRTRVRLSCGKNDLGFSKANSRDFVSIDKCPVLDKQLNNFDPHLRKYAYKGFLPAFLSDDGAVYDDTIHPVTVLGKQLFVSNKVFFQSNLSLLPDLITYVKDNLIGERIMDLYSGIGTFSAFLEDEAEVTAVEQNTYCLELARRHLKKTNFYTDKVENFSFKGKFDSIVIDPPRTGLDKKVPALLKKVKPRRIVYVSCDMVTLCRDLQKLQELNYSVESTKLFDFYPQTYHTETVAVLSLN